MTTQNITSLIAGLQVDDPRLYQALMLIQDRLEDTERELFPLVRQAEEIVAVAASVTAPVSFTFVFTPITVRFNWTNVSGAAQYEIRKATVDPPVWDTAAFQLRSTSLQADIDPLLAGTHVYLIKSINSAGDYSSTFSTCTVTVPEIGLVSISKQVIDNNVLLSWTTPVTTFNIKHYEVYKDATLLGILLSTFFVRFEAVAGTYAFKVVAVDIAGNRSPESTISVTVTAPPDYVLQDQRTTAFNGTKVNTRKDGAASLLACIVTETWAEHFLTRVWNDPNDQVVAGFPIYIQPTAPTGSYQEVIDYGVILSNIIITYTFQLEVLIDNVTVSISSRVSDDNSTWSSPQVGASFFASSVRYLEVTINFAATT
jgi:hypothetical protein